MVRSKLEDFDSRYVAPNPETSPVAPSPFALAAKAGPTNKISLEEGRLPVTLNNKKNSLSYHLCKYRQISIDIARVKGGGGQRSESSMPVEI